MDGEDAHTGKQVITKKSYRAPLLQKSNETNCGSLFVEALLLSCDRSTLTYHVQSYEVKD